MKKVIILGANGFIGSYLVKNIQGINIVPITRDDINLNDYFSVMDLLIKENPYAVINCAMSGKKSKIDNLDSDDVKRILGIFLNFYNLRGLFTKYINIGSGAEFDRETDIDYRSENTIAERVPADNYGYVKNVISRLCIDDPKFITLRLFGCFDKSEHEDRLFAKLMRNESINIIDKEFDFFSAEDFSRVVIHCLNNELTYKDLNCVYEEKLKLSETLNKFVDIHHLTAQINILDVSSTNYTGSAIRLKIENLKLAGLEQSIRNYK